MRDEEILVEVEAAEKRIRPYIRQTPLEPSYELSERTGADVYLKLESQQLSGSFKLRGAYAKISSLTDGIEHISELIDFLERRSRKESVLFHCFAGISRSPNSDWFVLLQDHVIAEDLGDLYVRENAGGGEKRDC